LNKLNNIYLNVLNNTNTVLIIVDAGVKNNVATTIAHIYRDQTCIKKLYYQAMNILPTEVELFAIRCSINQAVNIPDINYIVIITDTIHATEKILDFSCHLYQLHIITISHKLKTFFQANPTNSIAFWDCPSNDKWLPYYAVNRETKIYTIQPLYPSQVL